MSTGSHNRMAVRRRTLARIAWPAAVLCTLAGLSLFFLGSSPSAAGPAQPAAAAPAQQGLPVETATVAAAPASHQLTAVGTLQSNESVVVTAEIAGRVTQIGFREGERVAAGEVLVRFDPSVLEAERDRARASLELSEANHRRAEALLKENVISQRERDEAHARWRLDQANLRLAEAQLAKTVIRAPFGGVVGLRQVSLGGYLKPGDAVTGLEQIDPVKVDFRVPEVYAARLRLGQEIHLRVDAVPERSFAGKVYAIDPQVDAAGRSILVRARVANDGGPLRPGMFARIALVLEERAAALMIPEEALIPQAQGHLVYKVVDGKVEPAAVELGLRQKGRVEVTAGLQAGDSIITAGHLKVRPGMPVTPLPAATTPQEGK